VTSPIQSNPLSAPQLGLLQKPLERDVPPDAGARPAKPPTPNPNFAPVGRGRFIDITV